MTSAAPRDVADDPAELSLPSLSLSSPSPPSSSSSPPPPAEEHSSSDAPVPSRLPPRTPTGRIRYSPYRGEEDIPRIMELVDTELSEPYNFYTYRYFLNDWPHLCFMAYDGALPVGTIVCKQDLHRDKLERGYLAMLSTRPSHRGQGIATHLLRLSMTAMMLAEPPAAEVVLETEADNVAALRFYEKMGFIKEKRLYRFYMNAKDAYRLFLPLPEAVREEWQRQGGLDGRKVLDSLNEEELPS